MKRFTSALAIFAFSLMAVFAQYKVNPYTTNTPAGADARVAEIAKTNLANAVTNTQDAVILGASNDKTNTFGGELTILGNRVQEGATTSRSPYGHTEGDDTQTDGAGHGNHAEGTSTSATGGGSHAEGGGTVASGINSHAEGAGSQATGRYSHAAGFNAQANHDYSYVWSDGNGGASSAQNQYNVFATGGIRLLGGPITGNMSGTNIIANTISTDKVDATFIALLGGSGGGGSGDALTVGTNANINVQVAASAVYKISTNGLARVLFLGDSMSEAGFSFVSSATYFKNEMQKWFGQTNVAFMGGFSSFSCIADPNYAPWTNYWWTTPVFLFTNNTWLQYTYGDVNRLEVALVAQPLGGAVVIQTNGVTFRTISGYAATPIGIYTNFNLPFDNYYINIRTLTDVTNFLIGVFYYDTNSAGILPFYVSQGGSTLANELAISTNITRPIYAGIAPDLVIRHAKDFSENDETNVLNMKNDFKLDMNLFPPTEWVLIGTPSQQGNTYSEIQNGGFRNLAIGSTNVAYVDCYTPWNVYQYYTADGTHPTASWADWSGNRIINALGFDRLMKVPRVTTGGGSGNGNASTNVDQIWPAAQQLTNDGNVFYGLLQYDHSLNITYNFHSGMTSAGLSGVYVLDAANGLGTIWQPTNIFFLYTNYVMGAQVRINGKDGNVTASGTITAGSFSGSGASLVNNSDMTGGTNTFSSKKEAAIITAAAINQLADPTNYPAVSNNVAPAGYVWQSTGNTNANGSAVGTFVPVSSLGLLATNGNGGGLTNSVTILSAVPVTIPMQGGFGFQGFYITNAAFTVSAFAPLAGQYSSANFAVSNANSSAIVGTISAAYRAETASTTNSITIGAGKMAWFWVESFTGTETNHANSTQP